MTGMLEIVGLTFPLFAVIVLGYVVTRAGAFSGPDLRLLGRYTMDVAIPALIFGAVTRAPLGDTLNPVYLACFAMAAVGSASVVYACFALSGAGPARRAVAALGSSVPNSGYFGFPLLLLVLPGVAGSAFAMNVLVENVLIIPGVLILLEYARPHSARSLPALLAEVGRDVLRRPMVIGLILGCVVAASGWSLPGPIDRTLEMIARSAAAIALFVLGGTLVGLPVRGEVGMSGLIVLGKLVLMPTLAAGAAFLLTSLGAGGLSRELTAALVISAAVPTMSIYTVIAQQYGHEGLASLAQVGVHLGAFVTINAIVWLIL